MHSTNYKFEKGPTEELDNILPQTTSPLYKTQYKV